MNKRVIIRGIRDLLLDRWDLFEELFLESRLHQLLRIRNEDNRRVASNIIREALETANIRLIYLGRRESFDVAWQALGDANNQGQIYVSSISLRRLQEAYRLANQNVDDVYQRFWLPVAEMFTQREEAISINGLIHQTFSQDQQDRPVVIVDLSEESLIKAVEEPQAEGLER